MRLTIFIDASTIPYKWVKPKIIKKKGLLSISFGFFVIYFIKLTATEAINYLYDVANSK